MLRERVVSNGMQFVEMDRGDRVRIKIGESAIIVEILTELDGDTKIVALDGNSGVVQADGSTDIKGKIVILENDGGMGKGRNWKRRRWERKRDRSR